MRKNEKSELKGWALFQDLTASVKHQLSLSSSVSGKLSFKNSVLRS
jgi:hypothetical protein